MIGIPWVYAAYFFGGLLVTLYSLSAFNAPEYRFEEGKEDKGSYGVLAKPSLPRYMTEKFRYRTYSLLFVLFALAEYFLLAKLLPIIPGVDSLFQLNGTDKEVIDAATAFGSALLLIGAVNFIKWPRKLLFDFVKGWLHDFANIPEMGRSVFESLCYEPIDFKSDEAKAHIENLLQKNLPEEGIPRQDLQESDFKGGNSMSITWKWARLSFGIDVIEKWRDDKPLFAVQLKESSLGWSRLYQAYTDTIDDIISFRNDRLGEDQKVVLNNKIEELLANCHRLMACLVIMVIKPGEDPFLYIKDEGYRVIPGNRFSVKGGEIARIIVAIVPPIVLIALATLIASGNSSPAVTVTRIMRYTLSGLIILAVPVFIVLTAKRLMTLKGSWRTVTKKDPYTSFFEMPLLLYSGLSLFSFAISTVLMMLTVNTAHFHDLQSWKTMSDFCFVSAITAFFTAYRTDIPPMVYPTRSSYYLNRAKGALLQGILTAATVWLGLILYAPDIAFYKVLEFVAMGFAVAVAVHCTLFYGKHHFEKRRCARIYETRTAIAVIAGVEVSASLVNRSTGGASLKVNKNHTVPKGSEIELIMENDDHLFGRVERTDSGEMHIRFRQQPADAALA
jgi:hypothetical protein